MFLEQSKGIGLLCKFLSCEVRGIADNAVIALFEVGLEVVFEPQLIVDIG